MTNKSLIYVVGVLVLLSFALAAEVKVTCGSASVKPGDSLTCSVSLGQSVGQISTYSFVIGPGNLFTVTDATCTAEGYTGAYGSAAKKLSCATGGKKSPTQLADIILTVGNTPGSGKITLSALSILDYDGKAVSGLTIKDSGDITIAGACVPQCTGKACGDNGCGGSCGTCPSGENCDADGLCTAAEEDKKWEICDNAQDDDGDNLVDCKDVNCASNTACPKETGDACTEAYSSSEGKGFKKIGDIFHYCMDRGDGYKWLRGLFAICSADEQCVPKMKCDNYKCLGVEGSGCLDYSTDLPDNTRCASGYTCDATTTKCVKTTTKTIGSYIDAQLTAKGVSPTTTKADLSLLSKIAGIIKAWFGGGK